MSFDIPATLPAQSYQVFPFRVRAVPSATDGTCHRTSREAQAMTCFILLSGRAPKKPLQQLSSFLGVENVSTTKIFLLHEHVFVIHIQKKKPRDLKNDTWTLAKGGIHMPVKKPRVDQIQFPIHYTLCLIWPSHLLSLNFTFLRFIITNNNPIYFVTIKREDIWRIGFLF